MCSVFFKQKSAFEMRISDLISDVCSSDLGPSNPLHLATDTRKSSPMRSAIVAISLLCSHESSKLVGAVVMMVEPLIFVEKSPSASGWSRGCPSRERSEEHTSELQSLMRISYAVFCLKKKNIKDKTKDQTTIH